jgi:hypothetical protein
VRLAQTSAGGQAIQVSASEARLRSEHIYKASSKEIS